MFSLISGTPIAKVIGNPKYDLILIKDEANDADQKPKPVALNRRSGKKMKDFTGKIGGRMDNDLEETKAALAEYREFMNSMDSDLDSDDDIYNVLSEDEIHRASGSVKKISLSDYPKEKMKRKKEELKSQITIHEGYLTPVPNLSFKRDVLYVAGPSGAGKSTYVRRFLINYLKTYPERQIYIFSCVSKDEAFDDLPNLNRIMIDENIAAYNMSDFAESCVVFDDIDVIRNKEVRVLMQNIRDQALEIGRHDSITVCATSHQLTNYTQTRTLLNEATAVTVFPRSGASYHIKRWCREYVGLNAKQTEKVLALPSRWVTITRTAPSFVMYEKGVIMLHSL